MISTVILSFSSAYRRAFSSSTMSPAFIPSTAFLASLPIRSSTYPTFLPRTSSSTSLWGASLIQSGLPVLDWWARSTTLLSFSSSRVAVIR